MADEVAQTVGGSDQQSYMDHEGVPTEKAVLRQYYIEHNLLRKYQTFHTERRRRVKELESAGNETGEMHRERLAWEKAFLRDMDAACGVEEGKRT